MEIKDFADERDLIEIMRRSDLRKFLVGQRFDFSTIKEGLDAPAVLMRLAIRNRGLTGREPALAPPTEPVPVVIPVDEMKMPALRKRCKELGLGQSPKDKMVDLKARIKAGELAHGENAA